MPAMHYTVRWPDASESTCYSPSLIIEDFFKPGQSYPVGDFMTRVRQATAIANERVQAKFGFTCSRANDQLQVLESRARPYSDASEARIEVLSFGPAA